MKLGLQEVGTPACFYDGERALELFVQNNKEVIKNYSIVLPLLGSRGCTSILQLSSTGRQTQSNDPTVRPFGWIGRDRSG